jgi:HSP20 family protein
MSIIHWHPLKELNKLRQEMNSVFEEITHSDRLFDFNILNDRLDLSWSPAIAMTETEQKLILKVELPGIKAKDVDVRVGERMVSIAGEKKEEKHHQEKGCFCTEFSYGKFQRTVPLPIAIDKDNIEADFSNGLLTLVMSKNISAHEHTVKVNLLETKAREAMTQQRQDLEHQQKTMYERAAEELTEPKDSGNNIKEESREVMVEQRQQEKHQQETMQARITEEVSK